MKKVKVGDHFLAFDDQGSGIPTLFIHGYPLNRQMWKPQLDGLSDIARILLIDLRGHGGSDIIAGMNTMETFAKDCKEFLPIFPCLLFPKVYCH